jgi:hypothetical protein
MSDDRRDRVNRRQFLKTGGAAVVAGASAMREGSRAVEASQARAVPFAAPPIDTVRVGFVGVGLQGGGHVQNLLRIPGCRITAVCDIREERTTWATERITAAGHPPPAAYTRGPRDFERLCETEDLDLVYTATPWEWHVPVMLAAMRSGKHAATEVPAAMSLDDCWDMVETAEKQQKHCVMMENCNYDRMEMMVFNIVRQGLLGEMLHAEGGYLHDLRGIKFENRNEGLWRRAWSMKLDGNLYPTHGLGPVANCLDINRGDRFGYLVSMSGPSRGLQDWAAEHFPPDAPERRERYVLGDVNTSLIRTERGRTIVVQHCTNLPRPYSRIHLVQGSTGLFQGYPHRLYIEGRGRRDQWQDAAEALAEFEHPLWKEIAEQAQGAGHGGMDFIEDYRLIKCLREGQPTDMNVYDAAALSAVIELSVESNARKSRAMDFPDFTRGRWRTLPPLDIVHM